MKSVKTVLLSIFLTQNLINAETINIPEQSTNQNISIYKNKSVVTQQKVITPIKETTATIVYKNLPRQIEEDSVVFKDNTETTEIKTQIFVNKDFSIDSILEKNIGKKVNYKAIEEDKEVIKTGTLLSIYPMVIRSVNEELIFDIEKKKIVVDYQNNSYSITPSLKWEVVFKTLKEKDFNLSYILNGISCNMKYNMLLSQDEKKLYLQRKLEIDNKTDLSLKDTNLQCYFTQPKISTQIQPEHRMYAKTMMLSVDTQSVQPVSKEQTNYGDYYSMNEKVTLLPKTKKTYIVDEAVLENVKTYTKLQYLNLLNRQNSLQSNIYLEFVNQYNDIYSGQTTIYKKQATHNQLLAKTNIDKSLINEKNTISLGSDEKISVKIKELNRKKNETVFNGPKEITIENEITINNKSKNLKQIILPIGIHSNYIIDKFKTSCKDGCEITNINNYEKNVKIVLNPGELKVLKNEIQIKENK